MKNMKSRMAGFVELLRPIWIECNEIAMGIRTDASATAAAVANDGGSVWRGAKTDKVRHRDNHAYATPDYWYVRKVVSLLNPGPDDVVYDLGCGLGRFLCTVARKRVRRCVGVELFEPLCREAKKNAETLRGRKSRIDVVCGDVVAADLSDGTIYFMFNPFGAETMKDVLLNIEGSLVSNPRKVEIAYYNSFHEDVLASCSWLERFHHFSTHSGLPVTFWRNRSI